MKNIYNISYILILLFLLSSCAPKVLSFNAIPRNICARYGALEALANHAWKEAGDLGFEIGGQQKRFR